MNEPVNVDDARWSEIGPRGWPDLEAEPEMLHCFSAVLTLEMRTSRQDRTRSDTEMMFRSASRLDFRN